MRIVIEVRGGVVQGVTADAACEVYLCDYDEAPGIARRTVPMWLDPEDIGSEAVDKALAEYRAEAM